MEAQLDIRLQADSHRQYVANLSEWVEDMKVKEVASKTQKPKRTTPMPPPRIPASSNTNNENDNDPDAQRIRSDDYRSWDRFDVDAELAKVANNDDRGYDDNKQDIVDSEGADEALIQKELGNALFKKGNYKKAIQLYSKAISLDPSTAVYHLNRATAYLKLEMWDSVEEDCSAGIELDCKSVKAYWRRGIARREMGKFEESKKDFQLALVLEPTNKAVKQDLETLIETQSSTLDREGMREVATTKLGGKKANDGRARPERARLVIKEVNGFSNAEIGASETTGKGVAIEKAVLSDNGKGSNKDKGSIKDKGDGSDDGKGKERPRKRVSFQGLEAEENEENMVSVKMNVKSKPALSDTVVERNVVAPPRMPTPATITSKVKPREKLEQVDRPRIGGLVGLVPAEASTPDMDMKIKDESRKPMIVEVHPVSEKVAKLVTAEKSTILLPKQAQPTTQTTPPSQEQPPLFRVPTNLPDFEVTFKSKTTPLQIATYIKNIPPSIYPSLFKQSFDPSLLVKILPAFNQILTSTTLDAEFVKSVLEAFGKCTRFNMVVMLLGKDVRRDLEGVFERMRGVGVEVSGLEKLYKC